MLLQLRRRRRIYPPSLHALVEAERSAQLVAYTRRVPAIAARGTESHHGAQLIG